MDWTQFRENNGGILVVGHGTRRPDGTAQLVELAARMRGLLTDVPLVPCFLELAKPSIAEGLEQLSGFGVERIFVLPILLFEAGHARNDIPAAVAEAARAQGMSVVGQSLPLGTHESALRLSEKRFLEALRCSHPEGCVRAGGCHEREVCLRRSLEWDQLEGKISPQPKIGLAMVGRGTSDAMALAAMRHFTALRIERFPSKFVWWKTGFFAGGEPHVDELLAEAAGTSAETIVVQPHLLFEGELMEQLREKVRNFMAKAPSRRWLIPMPLGQDTALAQVFLDLALERVQRLTFSGG